MQIRPKLTGMISYRVVNWTENIQNYKKSGRVSEDATRNHVGGGRNCNWQGRENDDMVIGVIHTGIYGNTHFHKSSYLCLKKPNYGKLSKEAAKMLQFFKGFKKGDQLLTHTI